MAVSDILGGTTALSLGLEAYGTITGMGAASAEATASENITQAQIQENAVRRQAMEVSNRRQNLEIFRNYQKTRSMALASATGQGAQYGSGLQGGYGQIAGESGTNLVGSIQGLQAGEQMFNLSDYISQQEIAQSKAATKLATSQGITSLGAAIGGSSNSFKNIFGGS